MALIIALISLLIAFAKDIGGWVCQRACEKNLWGFIVKTLVEKQSISQKTKFGFDEKPIKNYTKQERAQYEMGLLIAERKALQRGRKDFLREERDLFFILNTLVCMVICSILWSARIFEFAPAALVFSALLSLGFIGRMRVYKRHLAQAYKKYVQIASAPISFYSQVGVAPELHQDGSVSYNFEGKINAEDAEKFTLDMIESVRATAFQEALDHVLSGADK